MLRELQVDASLTHRRTAIELNCTLDASDAAALWLTRFVARLPPVLIRLRHHLEPNGQRHHLLLFRLLEEAAAGDGGVCGLQAEGVRGTGL